MSGEKKQTIWTRNFICMMIANFLMLMSNFSTNTLVSTYASFLGAAPMLMGLPSTEALRRAWSKYPSCMYGAESLS